MVNFFFNFTFFASYYIYTNFTCVDPEYISGSTKVPDNGSNLDPDPQHCLQLCKETVSLRRVWVGEGA